jgi:hypothetical protein
MRIALAVCSALIGVVLAVYLYARAEECSAEARAIHEEQNQLLALRSQYSSNSKKVPLSAVEAACPPRYTALTKADTGEEAISRLLYTMSMDEYSLKTRSELLMVFSLVAGGFGIFGAVVLLVMKRTAKAETG